MGNHPKNTWCTVLRVHEIGWNFGGHPYNFRAQKRRFEFSGFAPFSHITPERNKISSIGKVHWKLQTIRKASVYSCLLWSTNKKLPTAVLTHQYSFFSARNLGGLSAACHQTFQHCCCYYYYYRRLLLLLKGKGPKPLICHNKECSKIANHVRKWVLFEKLGQKCRAPPF